MATLENIQGSSLVSTPDVSPLVNDLLEAFGTQKERNVAEAEKKNQADMQADIGILTGAEVAVDTEKQVELEQIGQISPELVGQIQDITERGDPEELAQFSAAITEGKDKADRLLSLGSQNERLSALREDLQKSIAEGTASEEDTARVIALSNMSEEQLNLELQKMQIIGNAAAKVIPKPEGLFSTPEKRAAFTRLTADNPQLAEQFRKNEVTRQAGIPEGFTLSEGQTRFGAQGEVIAARKPKRPTKTALVQNLEAAGIDPLSAEGKDIIKKSLTKPGVKIDLGEGLDFKIPPGFMLLEKDNPSAGVTPIPGGPQDSLTASEAAKTQMLETAKDAFGGVRELVFDKDGGLDRANLFNADFNTPFTDGRKLRNQMEFGIQAITRAETGAAMPPQEVENTRQRFMPKVGDTTEIANTKLDMYERFIDGSLQLIDPSGRFSSERFDTELESRTSPLSPEADAVLTGELTAEGFEIFQRPDGSTFAVSP